MKAFFPISLFLIFLILSIPFVSAESIASFVAQTGHGKNVLPASTNVQVHYEIGVDEPLPDLAARLKLGSNTFTCQDNDAGKHMCTATSTLDTSSITSSILNAKADIFTKKNYMEDNSQKTDSKTIQLFIDRLAPQVQITAIEQIGSLVNVSYKVIDYAGSVTPTDPTVCSGIKSISVGVAGKMNVAKTFTTTEKNICVYTGHYAIADLANGPSVIHVNATDWFDQQSQATSQSFTVDKTVPAIQSISVKKNGVDARFFKDVLTEATLTFYTEQSAKKNVTFDGVSLTNIEQACSTCHVVLPDITVSKDYSIVIYVNDTYGNIETTTYTLSASKDDQSASLTKIFGSDSQPRLGSSNNTLLVQFTESGSGFLRENVSLKVGSASATKKSCAKVAESNWQCAFDVAVSTLADGEYEVSVTGSDDVGNAIAVGTISRNITIDKSAPDVSNVSVRGVISSGTKDFLVTNGKASVSFNVSDRLAVKAFANFSNFTADGKLVTATCVSNYCTVNSPTLVFASPAGARQIWLNVTDELNNSIGVVTPEIMMYTLETNSSAEYFTHSLQISPGKIDRKAAEFASQVGYANVIVSSPFGNSDVLSSELVSCASFGESSGLQRDDMNYISEYEQLSSGSYNQTIIRFDFAAVPYENRSEIALECLIELTGRHETFFIPSETEKVYINFSLYNNTLGSIGESYDAELKAAIEDASSGIWGAIDTLKEILGWAQKLCQIFYLIQTLNLVMGSVFHALGVLAHTLLPNFFTAPAAVAVDTADMGACAAANIFESAFDLGFMQPLSYACQFISCKFSVTGGLIGMGEEGFMAGAQNSVQSRIFSTDSNVELLGDTAHEFANAGTKQTPSAGKKKGEFSSSDLLGFEHVDSNNNLIWAIANLCIPAIIKHLDNARQIKCRYAICLHDDVPNGVPKETCDQLRDYAECVWLYGNLLGAVLGLLDMIASLVQAIISNPIMLGLVIIAGACLVGCSKKFSITMLHTPCKYFYTAVKVLSLAQALLGIGDVFKSLKGDDGANDYCSQMENLDKEATPT